MKKHRTNYIWLFGRYAGNIRLINTCKNEKGEKCIATDGETVFAIQEQRSFLGIRYWRTIYTRTNYNDIVYVYKWMIVGHPELLGEKSSK